MAELVSDCPRCGTKSITFDLSSSTIVRTRGADWQTTHEAFCTCRHCHRSTIFVIRGSTYALSAIFDNPAKLVATKGPVNAFMQVMGFVSTKDVAEVLPPEHLPPAIESVFREATTCKAVNCYNAAATMFRLCLDLATRDKLPPPDEPGVSLSYKTRRDLGLRLPWLFDNKRLPEDLRELSHAVKEDGNDGAHAGNIGAEDVDDLLDFSVALLQRMFTEPVKLKLALERRDTRRKPAA